MKIVPPEFRFRCRKCRKPTAHRNEKGICRTCVVEAMHQVNDQLQQKRGRHYETWKAAMKKFARGM